MECRKRALEELELETGQLASEDFKTEGDQEGKVAVARAGEFPQRPTSTAQKKPGTQTAKDFEGKGAAPRCYARRLTYSE